MAVLAVSCKKDKIYIPAPTPVTQEIAVLFSGETIPFQNVDSAVVVLRDANQNIKKAGRLQNRVASLYESLADLPAGDYTAEIMIQTKKEADNTARQFAIKKTFTLPLQVNLQVKAPTGNFTTDTWFKRAVLSAPGQEAIAIVAMDSRDAFYEIKMKEAQWDHVQLQRYAMYHNAIAAIEAHTRNVQGVIGFTDYTSFDTYTQAMQGKLWTNAKISVSMEHQSGREVFFNYAYNQ